MGESLADFLSGFFWTYLFIGMLLLAWSVIRTPDMWRIAGKAHIVPQALLTMVLMWPIIVYFALVIILSHRDD